MADEPKEKETASALDDLLKQFQKIHDPKERKIFFEAHPQLAAVINPVNFH